MGNFGGLPENFDPERYATHAEPARPLMDMVDEGVTVLEVMTCKRTGKAHDAPDGGAPDGGVGTITCWRCRQRPDGNWDCWQIDCPAGWPPPTHIDEKILSE
jgi:hypothetical protein